MDLSGYVAGLVVSVQEIPKKDKLKHLSVNVGLAEPVAIVTNASNVGTRTVGCVVVIATVGALLRDGTKVAKGVVGGVPSHGMLCDAPMLGWVGGGAGTAVLLPESYNPGDQCPASKPRMENGGGEDSGGAATPGVGKSTGPGVDSLFETKLTQEEKKAAVAAKRAAKKSAAKAEGDDAGPEEGDEE
jgi:tRNA-binding EMAP/Myf-like protein